MDYVRGRHVTDNEEDVHDRCSVTEATEEEVDESAESSDDHVEHPVDAGTCRVLILPCRIFAVSCSADHIAKGAVVRAVPTSSEEQGDLKYDHRWSVMQEVMRNEVLDAVLMTTPTDTVTDEDAEYNEGLRDVDGPGWFGRRGISKSAVEEIKSRVTLVPLLGSSQSTRKVEETLSYRRTSAWAGHAFVDDMFL